MYRAQGSGMSVPGITQGVYTIRLRHSPLDVLGFRVKISVFGSGGFAGNVHGLNFSE